MRRGWQQITDLDPELFRYGDRELAVLAQIWSEQRDQLVKRSAFQEFQARLEREWAIETGLIERLYTLDRGITALLIERGIDAALIPHDEGASPELITAMIRDHQQAVDGLFDFIRDRRELSTSYVKELHALLTQHQETVDGIDSLGRRTAVPLIRGEYKRRSNNPRRPDGSVHEYCPPEHVASEMDRLIEMHRAHAKVAPEVEAAWLHHRFALIHPFQDGNGRVARTLATLVFIKAGWFPLVVRDRARADYIRALEVADDGDLGDLVAYFVGLQKREFLRAQSVAQDTIEAARVEDTIRSVREHLRIRRDSLETEWNRAREVAESLCNTALGRLGDVAEHLQSEMQDVLSHATFRADGEQDDGPRSHYYYHQIVQAAKEFDYFANTRSYRAWARLVMRNSNQTELLISFHGVGHEFQGILGCTATWFQRVETDDGSREVGPVTVATDDVFRINYKERLDEARERFDPWLDAAIVRSLTLWRDTVF